MNLVEECQRVLEALTSGGMRRVETEHITGYWVANLIRLDIKGVASSSMLDRQEAFEEMETKIGLQKTLTDAFTPSPGSEIARGGGLKEAAHPGKVSCLLCHQPLTPPYIAAREDFPGDGGRGEGITMTQAPGVGIGKGEFYYCQQCKATYRVNRW